MGSQGLIISSFIHFLRGDESVRDSLREHDYIKGKAIMDWMLCTMTSICEEKYMDIEYGALP
jgi:hypothetical protein